MTPPHVLVLGSGRSVVEAAKEVVAQGGRAAIVLSSVDTTTVPKLDGVEIYGGAVALQLCGCPGQFTARFVVNEKEVAIEGEAVILACERTIAGAERTVMGIKDAQAGLPGVSSVAMVLGPHASRSAHLLAWELALELRSRAPAPEVTIFADEVLVRGAEELIYTNAQKAGARVVRYFQVPEISEGAFFTVTAEDRPSGIEVCVMPDMVVAEGLSPPNDRPGEYARFQNMAPGSVVMGPLRSAREGLFLCRPEERGLCAEELMIEAKAAATLAMTFARTVSDRSLTAARVDRDKCSACLTCVRSCPFNAPHIDEEGKAAVESRLCRSCGICVAVCPSRAILLPGDEGWRTIVREGSP